MKIRMITTAAGPAGVFAEGKVYDLPKKQAQGFLEAGAACLPDESPSDRIRPRDDSFGEVDLKAIEEKQRRRGGPPKAEAADQAEADQADNQADDEQADELEGDDAPGLQ